MRAVAPALFSQGPVVAGSAIRLAAGRQDPVAVFQCGATCVTVPIDVSSGAVYLTFYGTGIRYRSSLQNVICTIGGVRVPVLYAGPQSGFPGLDQVNVALTTDLRGIGETDLVLTIDGQVSNPVRINVR